MHLHTKPSWYIVPTADQMLSPAVTRSMATRANAKITELKSGHVPMLSQPQAVAEVILEAVFK